jgi:hypothetical protein
LIPAYLVFRKITGLSIGCLFYKTTGLLCPGCGVTRMLDHALRGEISSAFRANPAVFLLSPVIAALVLLDSGNHGGAPAKKRKKIVRDVGIACVIALLIFGILRNLPAFGVLRPY